MKKEIMEFFMGVFQANTPERFQTFAYWYSMISGWVYGILNFVPFIIIWLLVSRWRNKRNEKKHEKK